MQTFKQIDAWLSVVLMVAGAIVLTITGWSAEGLMVCYCFIGGWQVVSMLIHFINRWFMAKKGARSRYHWITLGIFGIALVGWAFPPLLMIVFLLLLFLSPVLAIVYTDICFAEIKELKLSHSLNLR